MSLGVSPMNNLNVVTLPDNLYKELQKLAEAENEGMLSDDALFIEWANDYRHYLGLRQ
jgi:hypothetical protein